jgi:enoyl-CoA hydratase/carnithine racemase
MTVESQEVADTAVTLAGAEVVVLTIDNPPANTLSMAVLARIDEALDRVAASESARCLILAANGGQFVAGGDINELLETVGDEAAIAEHVALTGRLFERLRSLSIPVIAAVDGAAVGGGLELLLCCDLVVATESARFGVPEVKLGLIPGAGGTQRLARRIGPVRAAELLLTGRLIRAAEAKEFGLITEVVSGSAMVRAREFADRIAGFSPSAVSAAKRALVDGMDVTLEEGLALERRHFVGLMAHPETAEGLRAFLAR